jgi:hypothetical protein
MQREEVPQNYRSWLRPSRNKSGTFGYGVFSTSRMVVVYSFHSKVECIKGLEYRVKQG